jgi:7,8-dihydroneopterin aldolase/epimerase/oxygenase
VDEDPDHLNEDEDEGDEGFEPAVTIEITGLSLYTHHGVEAAEREVGQRLIFDLSFEVSDCAALVTDEVEDTVDYADVCQQVAFTAQERSYKTLERLCSAVADRMIERYGADAVSVRAAKPEPPIALPVDEVAVEVWKERSED